MYKKEQFRTAAAIMSIALFLTACNAPSIPGIENASDGSETAEEASPEAAAEEETTAEETAKEEAAAEVPEETPAEGTEETAEEEVPEETEEDAAQAQAQADADAAAEAIAAREAEKDAAEEKKDGDEDPLEAMEPILESAAYAYYFNEKYITSLTADDATLFDTAMTAYAAQAVELGTGKRTMHSGSMTVAIAREDLANAAFAMFPDFASQILDSYNPADHYHGGADKKTFFITPAAEDTYAMTASVREEGKKNALADVFVLGSKGDVLARYNVTMQAYTGGDTDYAYQCKSVETVWRASGEDDYYLNQEELVPILESLGKDSFTDAWEKEGRDEACRLLLEWAIRNVNDRKEKDARAALADAVSTVLEGMDDSAKIRFLAVWPSVKDSVEDLLESEDLESLMSEWEIDMAEVSAEDAAARWEILGDEIYDSILRVGFGTLEKTKKEE